MRVVSSACLRLLIFLPAVLIPACALSSPAFLMMYSTYKLNKQGDNIQPSCTPFPIWNQSVIPCPILTIASWPAYRFLKRQVMWSGIPTSFRIFQFIVIQTVKGFAIFNEAEIDVFLELSCFFDDPVDVGNLISGSFAFSKTSLKWCLALGSSKPCLSLSFFPPFGMSISTVFHGIWPVCFHRFAAEEEFCLRMNCTLSFTHIWFRWDFKLENWCCDKLRFWGLLHGMGLPWWLRG